mgnify:CR=1 FL=1
MALDKRLKHILSSLSSSAELNDLRQMLKVAETEKGREISSQKARMADLKAKRDMIRGEGGAKDEDLTRQINDVKDKLSKEIL